MRFGRRAQDSDARPPADDARCFGSPRGGLDSPDSNHPRVERGGGFRVGGGEESAGRHEGADEQAARRRPLPGKELQKGVSRVGIQSTGSAQQVFSQTAARRSRRWRKDGGPDGSAAQRPARHVVVFVASHQDAERPQDQVHRLRVRKST